MEKTTKQRILEESMKLFALKGYDSVSVRTIAAAVKVSDSALYKHYKSKKEIFDTIVNESRQRFMDKFNMLLSDMQNITFTEMCLTMYRFQTQDEWIVNFRQMLVMEQFKNPEMAAVYKELFIDLPIKGESKIFTELISKGVMKDKDPKVLAMELYAPFFLYHTIKDNTGELEKRFMKHAEYFKENYFL